MKVHEPRRDDAARRVEHDGALRDLDRLLDGDDAAVFDEDVSAALAGLVDQGPAADDDLACVSGCVVGRHQISPDPSRWKRMAMRTRTPFLTWRVTRDAGRSATSGEISTPRIIGPGCMIRAPLRMAAARALVSP